MLITILVLQASNWVLKRMKPNRWLPFIVSVWGIVTTLSGLVDNFGGLVVIRLMLGLCEGGLLPGIVSTFISHHERSNLPLVSQILYLSTIYKRHELQLRYASFSRSSFKEKQLIASSKGWSILCLWWAIILLRFVRILTISKASLSGAFGGTENLTVHDIKLMCYRPPRNGHP